MIGQYLPQTNESATVPKTFQFSELNKTSVSQAQGTVLLCVIRKEYAQFRNTPHPHRVYNNLEYIKKTSMCIKKINI